MTTTSLPRSYSPPVTIRAAEGIGAALVTAAVPAVLGQPALSLVPLGALLLWGLHEAGAPNHRRRLVGHASALIALGSVLQVCMPRFLAPAADYLLLVVLTAVPLVAVWAAAPAVSRTLALRRPRPGDFGWLALCFALSLGMVLGAVHGSPGTPTSELAALTALVVVLPILDEAVYRGILMAATGDSLRAVLGVAFIEGLAVVPALGLAGLLAVTVLGTVLGLVRRTTGSWQTSLAAHWGIALGLAAPILMATGVGS